MLLTIENLEVQYGKQTALKIDTPVIIEKGDRIGVIGSNGAGKTTLVKSILGLTNYSGRIRTELKRKDMAVHLQENEYVNTMPVKYIIEGILNTKIKSDLRLRELISFFEFEQCLSKRFRSLSGGQKQRLTIIMVLMQNAPLTFYDEVTSGLDFETRQRLMGKLVDWYKEKDSSLIVVSHYYEELEQLVDKILILDKGNVVAYGEKEQLFQRYCGGAVIILDNTKENEWLTREFEKLKAPKHLIALSCRERKSEMRALSLLSDHNVNFKRSNDDIEIMSINAKQYYYSEKEGGNQND